MKQETAMLLDKARRAIGAARALLERGDNDFAIGRAYYAMFYAAEALLVERELRFRKHSGVQAAFGEHFAKAGLLDPKYHRYLLDAGSKRLSGDYGVEILLESEDVLATIEQAKEFAAAARAFLGDS
jgi:uncharacterized protein (UPF0332 family)